jgi:hypothetical protein
MAITITPSPASNPRGVQASYPLNIGEGRWGAVYDGSDYTSRSYVNGDADPLVFGQPVSHFGEGKVRDYTAATGFGGFALISDTFTPAFRSLTINSVTDTHPGYPSLYTVNVLEVGTIWVRTSNAVSKGGRVALLDAGAPTVCASGTASSTNIPAYFLKDAGAGELVPIQLTGLI